MGSRPGGWKGCRPAAHPQTDARLQELKRSLRTMQYARLLAGLRARQPDDMIGKSILIYRLTRTDLEAILDLKPPPEPGN